MDTEASRREEQKTAKDHLFILAGIGMAAAGVLGLATALRDVLQGGELGEVFSDTVFGMGCLGIALAQLGVAPSAPLPRRIYYAVGVLIPVSLMVVQLWLLLR